MQKKKGLNGFVAIVSILLLVSTLKGGEGDDLLLCGFEGDTEVSKIACGDATLELSTEHVTQGKYSAEMTCPGSPLKESYPGFKLVPGEKDWSKYDTLALDIYRTSGAFQKSRFAITDNNKKVYFSGSPYFV